VLQKSNQQKQTTQVLPILKLKFNSLFICLFAHEESNLLTWTIRTVSPNLVMYGNDLRRLAIIAVPFDRLKQSCRITVKPNKDIELNNFTITVMMG